MASEQLIQNGLDREHSTRVLAAGYRWYSLGDTTIAELQSHKIINSRTKKFSNKKPDGLVIDSDGHVVIYVQYKDPKELTSKKKVEAATEVQIDVADAIGADIFLVTDSGQFFWFNPKTKNRVVLPDGTPYSAQFDPNRRSRRQLEQDAEQWRGLSQSLSKVNDTVLPEYEQDPSDLARVVHQKLYIAKTASPQTSLYTFVELFVFKYLSDLGVLTGLHSFEHLRSLYEDGNDEEKVLNFYLGDSGPREYIKTLFPAGSDGTTIINGDVFHTKTNAKGQIVPNGDGPLFHRIIETFQKYENEHGKFLAISKDFKSKLFETFLQHESDKKKMGQFFTPLTVVKQIVRMAGVHPGMSICDPACGVGKFLLEAASVAGFDSVELKGYDKVSEDDSDRTIVLAKANMLIYLSDLLKANPTKETAKELAEKLNDAFLLTKTILGTLEENVTDTYDLVLTNPPYIVNGSGDIKRAAAKVGTGRFTWGGLGVEALFMEWIVKALKPMGMAFVVVPDGIMQNIPNARLRRAVLDWCYIRAVISLPINTFYGTPKKTFILVIERKLDSCRGIDGQPPFFNYLCSSIGETLDVNRLPIESNDLEEAASNYLIFKAQGFRWPDCIERSPRLKIVDGSYLADNADAGWETDKCWTHEEKIALGVEKPTLTVSISEFRDMLEDAIQVVGQLREEL